jgi:hypothetical protein
METRRPTIRPERKFETNTRAVRAEAQRFSMPDAGKTGYQINGLSHRICFRVFSVVRVS